MVVFANVTVWAAMIIYLNMGLFVTSINGAGTTLTSSPSSAPAPMTPTASPTAAIVQVSIYIPYYRAIKSDPIPF